MCKPPTIQTKYVEVKSLLPQELLSCKHLQYTQEYFKTQLDVANFILDLNGAYKECKEKLDIIRELQNELR